MTTLQQLRKNKGYTQNEIALMVGFKSKAAICNMEKGLFQPKAKIIKKLSEIYDCSIAQIVNGLIELEK